jgi:hypothetical protein
LLLTNANCFIAGIPSVTGILPNHAPAIGGSVMTIFGLNLGPVKAISQIRIGETTAMLVTIPTSDQVTIRIPEGVGSDLDVVVMIDGKIGISNKRLKFSYGMPHAISSWPALSVANQPATSSISLTIVGSSFGTQDYSTFRRVGFSSGEAVRWASDTVVVTKVAAGSFGTRTLDVTVARVRNTRTEFFSYDIAIASSLNPNNSPPTGSVSITIFGADFAKQFYTGSLALSVTAQEHSFWFSDSAVVCQASSSLRRTRNVVMTIGLRVGSSSEMISHSSPEMSNGRRLNSIGTGCASVTVLGLNFGIFLRTSSIQIGKTEAERSFWISESAVRSKASSVAFSSLRSTISCGVKSGSVTESFSADLDTLSVLGRRNAVATGSLSVTVYGANLGTAEISQAMGVSQTKCENTLWHSSTSITGRTGHEPAASRRIFVTAGLQAGSNSVVFSAQDAGLSTVRKSNGVVSGSVSITVHGACFSLASYSPMFRPVSTDCESLAWDSDTSVKCRSAHSISATRVYLASIGNRYGSMTQGFSSDFISPSSIREINAPSSGSAMLTIFALNLGRNSYSASIKVAHTSAEGTDWNSQTAISCRIPRGLRSTKILSLTVGQRFSSQTKGFSADKASVSSYSRQNIASSASSSITIFGLNFGQTGMNSASARRWTSSSEGSLWISDSSITSRSSYGISKSRRIQVSIGVQISSSTQISTFDRSLISVSRSVNAPGTGAVSISVFGSNFDLTASTNALRVRGTSSLNTKWEADSSLLCLSGYGISRSNRFSVSVGSSGETISSAFSFDPSMISLPGTRNRAGTGSSSCTIYGKYLGSASYTASSRSHLSAPEGTCWESDTSVRSKVPQGTASTRIVISTVGEGLNSVTESFSFDVPSMSIVFPVNNPPEGSMTFTIFGKLFGKVSRSIISRLGGTSCEASIWAADTTAYCKFAAGIRGTRRVSVTSKRKAGTRTEIFSYNSPGISASLPANGATTG